MEEEMKEQGKKIAKVIAKAWSDEAFKERLLSEPKTVLETEGIKAPEGAEVMAVEQTEKKFYFVIPAKPQDISITDENIESRAAALACQCVPTLQLCH
jgi:hypothetical protein